VPLCCQLLPSDPVGKAAARLIIQRFSDKAVPAFYRMLVQQDKAVQAAAAAALDAELQWLVDNIDPAGPFALGPDLGLVDCAVVPFLLRLYVLEHYRWVWGRGGCGCGPIGPMPTGLWGSGLWWTPGTFCGLRDAAAFCLDTAAALLQPHDGVCECVIMELMLQHCCH
jgi:hypothetical protein